MTAIRRKNLRAQALPALGQAQIAAAPALRENLGTVQTDALAPICQNNQYAVLRAEHLTQALAPAPAPPPEHLTLPAVAYAQTLRKVRPA